MTAMLTRLVVFAALIASAHATQTNWTQLVNGKDLSNWDKWLGLKASGYSQKTKEPPLGFNNDPRGVFTVVEKDGALAIRVSGEIFGAITTWSDPQQRSASGYLGLQNYKDDKTVRFRNLRIRDLPSGAQP